MQQQKEKREREIRGRERQILHFKILISGIYCGIFYWLILCLIILVYYKKSKARDKKKYSNKYSIQKSKWSSVRQFLLYNVSLLIHHSFYLYFWDILIYTTSFLKFHFKLLVVGIRKPYWCLSLPVTLERRISLANYL